MRNLGDITKISGYNVPITDCLVGGSPCQDLSVAGLRKGLDGERSVLFLDQVRITKEMRDKDERINGRSGLDIRPRYFVFENVAGIFSSNKNEDFRKVLEEIAKIKDENAYVPRPEDGKWQNAGCIVGNGYSIAWRIFNSQYWGVPQRRRRICLVADLNGYNAPHIVFNISEPHGDAERDNENAPHTDSRAECRPEVQSVSESLSGYTQPSREEGQGTPNNTESSTPSADRKGTKCYGISPFHSNCMLNDNPHSGIYEAETSRTLDLNGGNPTCNQGGMMIVEPCLTVDQGGGKSGCSVLENQAPTLSCTHDGSPAVCYSIENHPADSRVDITDSGVVQTLTERMGTGGGNVPMVMEQKTIDAVGCDIYNLDLTEGVACTRTSESTSTDTSPKVITLEPGIAQREGGHIYEDVSGTIRSNAGDNQMSVCYALDRPSFNQGTNAKFDFEINDKGINSPLVAKGPSAVAYGTSYDKYYSSFHTHVDENISATLQASDYKDPPTVVYGFDPNIQDERTYIVRRLTPLECERLQGFPDNFTSIGDWVDSKGKVRKCTDANRYKALGNSISLPNWRWVIRRICATYERPSTLCSLFDGIGGFPLLWEEVNGKGSCLWTSEIDDFPIAVTRLRFGER